MESIDDLSATVSSNSGSDSKERMGSAEMSNPRGLMCNFAAEFCESQYATFPKFHAIAVATALRNMRAFSALMRPAAMATQPQL